MEEQWRYLCLNCGNGCLKHWEKGRPTVCSCADPDWKLIANQKPYHEDGKPWVHPLGEVENDIARF